MGGYFVYFKVNLRKNRQNLRPYTYFLMVFNYFNIFVFFQMFQMLI